MSPKPVMMRVRRRSLGKPALAGLALAFAGILAAHEGHQPLPTRGVQVDTTTGRIALSDASRRLLDVDTAAVTQNSVSGQVRAYATLTAPWTRRAVVTSRLSGRLIRLHVRPGDSVSAGQPVAEIQSLTVRDLIRDLQLAGNAAKGASDILNALETAVDTGAVAGQRKLDLQLQLQQAMNEIRVLEARADSLGISLPQSVLLQDPETSGEDGEPDLTEPTRTRNDVPEEPVWTIRSPISGVTGHFDLAVGRFVEPSEHLMEVIDLSAIDVRISVPEQEWANVQTGQQVELDLFRQPSVRISTRITSLGGMPDRDTGQTTAWGVLHNSDGNASLLPGMNAEAHLLGSAGRNLLTIPSTAVFSNGVERYVLVEEARTKTASEYLKVPVFSGRASGGMVEVLAGKLHPGDQVVTRGGHELSALFIPGVVRIGQEMEQAIGLKLEHPSERPLARTLSLEGRVDLLPDKRSEVSAAMEGAITNVKVERGQAVRKGDLLCEIFSLKAQDLQMQLLKTHLDLLAWNAVLERRDAAAEAIAGRIRVETANRVRDLRVQAASLVAQLQLAGLEPEQIETMRTTGRLAEAIPVRAPIDGRVADFSGITGQVVAANAALFEIHNSDSPWIRAFVREQESAAVRPGQSVRIRLVAFPGAVFRGEIRRMSPLVETQGRVQSIWVEPQEALPEHTQHAMAARVTVSLESVPAALAIARESIVREGLQSWVFVREADGRFERRRIRTGRSDDLNVEVLEGLSADDSVAAGGVRYLQTAYAAVR